MKKPLILIPTAMEAEMILGLSLQPNEILEIQGGFIAATCGFGLPIAASLSSHVINRSTPSSVHLFGIAGTYDEAITPIGSLVQGTHVRVRGIGAGQGNQHQDAIDLGFDMGKSAGLEGPAIDLTTIPGPIKKAKIQTIAAASASLEEARANHAAFEDALIEDMETYSVALSCHLANTRLTVVRAISNVAGIRDKSTWDIAGSLATLRSALPAILSTQS